jgi:oligopeptide transport system permease protein
LFARGLPVSITLGALALSLAVLIGGTLGTVAAFRQNSAADYAVTGFGAMGLTVPNFVVAPVLQIVFGLELAWLPSAVGAAAPSATSSCRWRRWRLPQIAVIARMTRAAMIETLRSNHIRTLRSLGLPDASIVRHALRGAALPVVSYLGPAAAALLTGSVVVETIFGLPGVGRYFVEGALNRDYTLVMGTVVLIAVFVLFFNLLVDVLYALLDPRVRFE